MRAVPRDPRCAAFAVHGTLTGSSPIRQSAEALFRGRPSAASRNARLPKRNVQLPTCLSRLPDRFSPRGRGRTKVGARVKLPRRHRYVATVPHDGFGSSSVTAAGSQRPPVASGEPPVTDDLAWWLSTPL